MRIQVTNKYLIEKKIQVITMREYKYNTNTCMKNKTLGLKFVWRGFRGSMCLKTHTWSAYVKYDHKYMPDIKNNTYEIHRSNALHNVWEKKIKHPTISGNWHFPLAVIDMLGVIILAAIVCTNFFFPRIPFFCP